jgi:hypothetical protein
MLQFRVKNVVPPGGKYFYHVDELNVTLHDASMTRLLAQVSKYLSDNAREVPPDLEAKVEDYICRNVPEGFCFGSADGRPRARIVTLASIRDATTRMVMQGGGRVDLGDAKKRVDICGQCPHNDRRMCPSCVGLVSWARRLVNTQCPRDEWLGVCAVDGTALPAKVHVKTIPGSPDYPENCWVNGE